MARILDLKRFEGHTDGPWIEAHHTNGHCGFPISKFSEKGHQNVATVYCDEISSERDDEWNAPENKESRANSLLIAAAPDLLAEVKSMRPDGDEVVISKQSLKDLLFLARHYETRGIYDREAKEKFAAAVAEAKGKLGDHGDTNAG